MRNKKFCILNKWYNDLITWLRETIKTKFDMQSYLLILLSADRFLVFVYLACNDCFTNTIIYVGTYSQVVNSQKNVWFTIYMRAIDFKYELSFVRVDLMSKTYIYIMYAHVLYLSIYMHMYTYVCACYLCNTAEIIIFSSYCINFPLLCSSHPTATGKFGVLRRRLMSSSYDDNFIRK